MAKVRGPWYPHYVLAMLTLAYTCSYIDRYILSVLVEPIKAELGVSDTLMGLLGGFSFALLYTFAGIPIARWADRGTRRNIIAIGIAVWSVMTVACGLVRTFPQLVLARVGVGLGEAACTPPSHSLIGDYFPPGKRATALSIYTMGIPFGVMLGFLCGGWIAHFFDWRIAFIVVGLPGLLLALVLRFTVDEPVRGRSEGIAVDMRPVGTAEALRHLVTRPTFVCLQIGGAFYALWGYGISFWAAPFFSRVHHMPLEQLATWLAAGAFIGGVGGGYLAGRFADRYGRRWLGWYFLTPVIGLAVGLPATVAMLTVDSRMLALLLFLVQQACGAAYAGPVYALMQFIVNPRMRALAVAIHLFILNLVGLGLGPLLIGALSDHYTPALGAAGALTLALLVVSSGGLIMVAAFLIGPVLLRRENRVSSSNVTESPA